MTSMALGAGGGAAATPYRSPPVAEGVSTGPAVIECDGLVHSFGSKAVLHGVTFAVPRGSVYGFIGPNGAGKTTTLRILATLLEPLGGTARVAGHDVVTHPDRVRRVLGYMPDGAGVRLAQGRWGAIGGRRALPALAVEQHGRPQLRRRGARHVGLGGRRVARRDALRRPLAAGEHVERTCITRRRAPGAPAPAIRA